MLGLERGVVRLAPHQAVWSVLFEEEKGRLEKALGSAVLDVQHIGSTSIPGIKAKPILDVGVAVRNFEEAFVLIPKVERLGYLYRGENGIPRRHYFVKGTPERRTHHLHMVELDSEEWTKNLLFRDYLRRHPEAARAYQALKEALATQYPRDREAYTDGKHAFVQEVLQKARAELLT